MFFAEILTLEKLIPGIITFAIFAALALLWVFVVVPIITKVSVKLSKHWIKLLADAFKKPVLFLFVVSGLYFALQIVLRTQVEWQLVFVSFYRVFVIYCVAWGLISSKSIVKNFLSGTSGKDTKSMRNETLAIFATRIYCAIVVVFALLMALSDLNFDVTGILTGLGLGSLTVALAAQDAAGNFFGGLVIIIERPFEVGDWISADVIEGSVEDITFRSTKIRTLDGSLTIVPNSKLSSSALTNWTKLEHRLSRFTLGVMYSTPKNIIESVCTDLESMLKEHSAVEEETVEVCLQEFSASSIDLLVTFYIRHVDIKEYRAAMDDINYKIIDIMQNNSASFAFPSQSIYFENALKTEK